MGKTAKTHDQKNFRQKWATSLQGEENKNINDMYEYLWIKGKLNTKSIYCFVKYCLLWCFNVLEQNYPNYKNIINGVTDD